MSDVDDSHESKLDPTIKVPEAAEGEASLREQQADAGNDRDLADKAKRGAHEFNFQTGKLEPVADHLAPDGSGLADGPDDPHVGNAEQSVVDDPKAAGTRTVTLEPADDEAPPKPRRKG